MPQISISLVFGTDCELKRTDHDASPVPVFVPNPSLLCRVFVFHGFLVEESKGGEHGDAGIGEEGMGPVA